MLDLLSDILTRLSLTGTLYFRLSATPPFGIEVPAYENVTRFHFAYRGECVVHVSPPGQTVTLLQGDLVIIPHGARHFLLSPGLSPEAASSLDRVVEESGYDGSGALVYGGSEDPAGSRLICGHFSLAPESRHILFDRLPPLIVLRNYGETAGAWLDATLRAIAAEAGSGRLGSDLIALKMSEAIFAQAIRTYLERDPEDAAARGLSGFADPHLARSLTAFHRDPARDWTVGALAAVAGLSRTGFAQRFAAKLGMTPMRYATAWRLQLARRALSERGLTVAQAAQSVGYASEPGFSRAFRREFGIPPASYRGASSRGG